MIKHKVPAASFKEVEDFVKYSAVWEDIQVELNKWLEEIHNRLENLDGVLTSRDLDRLGGSAEAVRNMLSFPDILMTNAKSRGKSGKPGNLVDFDGYV